MKTFKARKHAFEVRMQDQNCHLLAAETEAEANGWIATINQALQSTIEAQIQNDEIKNGKYWSFLCTCPGVNVPQRIATAPVGNH